MSSIKHVRILASQSVANGGSSTAAPANVFAVRVIASAAAGAAINIGVAAATPGTLISSTYPEYFSILPGEKVFENGTGALNVTFLSR